MRNILVWAVIAVTVLVTGVAVTRDGHGGPTLGALAIVALVLGVGMLRGVRAWVARRGWVAVAAGVALIVAGTVLPLMFIQALPADWLVGGAVTAITAGIALALLPLTAARIEAAHASIPAIKRMQAAPAPEDFSGPRAARDAFAGLAARPLDWLRIAGPWILLNWVLIGAMLAVSHGLKRADLGVIVWGMLLVVAALLLTLVGLVAVAVAWSRVALGAEQPRIPALPGRVVFGLMWPLVLVFLVGAAGEHALAGAGAWIDAQLGPASPISGEGVMAWIVGALAVFYLAMIGLTLPGRAAGDRAMTGGVSRVAVRKLGFGYFLGLACIGVPWAAASAILDRLGDSQPKDSPAKIALWLLGMPVATAFVAVIAGYLVEAYRSVAPPAAP